MKNISLTIKNPIDENYKTVFVLIDEIARSQQISYFIAGAMARDLLLYHVFDIHQSRKTRDIDTAVLVPNWEAFDLIKSALTKSGFSETNNAHCIKHDASSLPLDIVPFGDIADDKGEIQWPPKHEITMSVAGFQEAFNTAVTVDIGDDVHLKVASWAGLTILKLIAWQERRLTSNKDAADLLTLLLEYHRILDDRLYEEDVPAKEFEYDPSRIGAYLLGKDVKLVLSQQAGEHIAAIQQVIQVQRSHHTLIQDLLKEAGSTGPDLVEQLHNDFWTGVGDI
ncbi:nucleotidyl transferase AbiEii/AbiGii toxin family protein [Aeromonas taiwanensis]|uniref:nucleotidyl transferase AbiEii/AbiGii toxin family protein n=1 Tax=Aeromonas taiwanensis TaxID=633417 RepID=UPI003989B89A